MSTLAFAQLTNTREAADPGTSTSTSSPGVGSYLDVLAALVPSEVLALHALVIAATTKVTVDATGSLTRINADAFSAVRYSFWILIVMSLAMFAVPRLLGGKWDRFDWVRLCIAPLAFVGWTMMQRTTAFDAAFPGVPDVDRTITALFLAAALGALVKVLSMEADAKPPP